MGGDPSGVLHQHTAYRCDCCGLFVVVCVQYFETQPTAGEGRERFECALCSPPEAMKLSLCRDSILCNHRTAAAPYPAAAATGVTVGPPCRAEAPRQHVQQLGGVLMTNHNTRDAVAALGLGRSVCWACVVRAFVSTRQLSAAQCVVAAVAAPAPFDSLLRLVVSVWAVSKPQCITSLLLYDDLAGTCMCCMCCMCVCWRTDCLFV